MQMNYAAWGRNVFILLSTVYCGGGGGAINKKNKKIKIKKYTYTERQSERAVGLLLD